MITFIYVKILKGMIFRKKYDFVIGYGTPYPCRKFYRYGLSTVLRLTNEGWRTTSSRWDRGFSMAR